IKSPLTPTLSPQARLGELATIRKRMRMGRRSRPGALQPRSLSPWGERQSARGSCPCLHAFLSDPFAFAPNIAYKRRAVHRFHANEVGPEPLFDLAAIFEAGGARRRQRYRGDGRV